MVSRAPLFIERLLLQLSSLDPVHELPLSTFTKETSRGIDQEVLEPIRPYLGFGRDAMYIGLGTGDLTHQNAFQFSWISCSEVPRGTRTLMLAITPVWSWVRWT